MERFLKLWLRRGKTYISDRFLYQRFRFGRINLFVAGADEHLATCDFLLAA